MNSRNGKVVSGKVDSIRGVDVLVAGKGGPTVLMLHGWPDTSVLWDEQVAAMQSNFRCVRFTLPGFATGSPRRATSLDEMLTLINDVIDLVSPEQPVVLLLHDWGCFFGYQYAMHRPDRVQRVIGIDVGDTGSPDHVRSLSAPSKAMIASYQLWLAAAWRIGGAPGTAMTRALARALKAPAAISSVHSGMDYPYDIRWTRSHGSYDAALPLELACPLFFIYGRHKPFMFHSPGWATGLVSQPSCRVLGLATGHWVMKDDPTGVNNAILEWLATPVPG